MVSAQSAVLPSAVPAVSAPTRLRVPDLLQATDRYADDVLVGRYDHLLPAGGPPTDDRWFTRLHGDDELDVWLISWVPDRVDRTARPRRLAGCVDRGVRRAAAKRVGTERRCVAAGFGPATRPHSRWAGCTTSCGRRTRDLPAPVSPTLSVHAYSPPLTAMSYYEVTERNTLRRKRTELTDAPEGTVMQSNRPGARRGPRPAAPALGARRARRARARRGARSTSARRPSASARATCPRRW